MNPFSPFLRSWQVQSPSHTQPHKHANHRLLTGAGCFDVGVRRKPSRRSNQRHQNDATSAPQVPDGTCKTAIQAMHDMLCVAAPDGPVQVSSSTPPSNPTANSGSSSSTAAASTTACARLYAPVRVSSLPVGWSETPDAALTPVHAIVRPGNAAWKAARTAATLTGLFDPATTTSGSAIGLAAAIGVAPNIQSLN
jgi:hypothetical protein